MTHCTNCSCPMTCNAFERCVREPEIVSGVADELRRLDRLEDERFVVRRGDDGFTFARSATPHRTETP